MDKTIGFKQLFSKYVTGVLSEQEYNEKKKEVPANELIAACKNVHFADFREEAEKCLHEAMPTWTTEQLIIASQDQESSMVRNSAIYVLRLRTEPDIEETLLKTH